MKTKFILLAALAVSACETTGDPADGGFLNGVMGIGGGGFQERVDDQQAALDKEEADAAALQAQQASVAQQSRNLAAEITRLRAVHTQLRIDISNQVSALRNSGVVLSVGTSSRVNAVVNASPTGNTDAQRLASLQAAIANARALSGELAQLS